ncbi:MAG: lipoyl(octanoyl) transferase LipB [Candidatus Marinimicrobia bacterium]|jgi:lipoate-protein ligase B|nr:lipoyl(octanoyl) transferase LipB [Candidatus Neomarinimicrobiota bacterium]MBT3936494.1 lipoyl(octanoyl) transferase LipB [Candidatus Neomarinimicrobiota bacterium]MBT3962459.1 lipoyl(octanoyl) transferase LipB [Candidatus Neomarinimicrobiota bacterium]MBT4383884.1 lipoyl(octanoyl) transferase LipB [Candidatus Neomarinimicrobiota bacterium]MBT4636391.1 lipoyl(octanoyl) transferase LipB [Candidatus Neomarinimicrobiota bacterium]
MIKSTLSKIDIIDLGVCPYNNVWVMQKELQQKRIDGTIDDTLILVEHEPVYTLGKNADENHLLQNRDKSIKVYNIERGGDITFHGPGQLVGYPILDLSNYQKSISWYMRKLEQVIIELLSNYGINADRNIGLTGVWVGDEKIAALGVRISRWVTMHGFSININPDLRFYDGIIPCGILEHGVTSMKETLSQNMNVSTVKPILIEIFNTHFSKEKVNA